MTPLQMHLKSRLAGPIIINETFNTFEMIYFYFSARCFASMYARAPHVCSAH